MLGVVKQNEYSVGEWRDHCVGKTLRCLKKTNVYKYVNYDEELWNL